MTHAAQFNCKCESCEAARREARSHFTVNPIYGLSLGPQELFPRRLVESAEQRHGMALDAVGAKH